VEVEDAGLVADPDFGVEVASVRIVAIEALNDLIDSADAGQLSLNPAGPVFARVGGPAPPAAETPPTAGRRGLRERLHVGGHRSDPSRDERIAPANRARLRAWIARPLAEGLAAADAGEADEAVRSVLLAYGRAMYFGDLVTYAVAALHAARILADQQKWDQGLNVLLTPVIPTPTRPAP
jgi:hypothetical protein